MGFVSFLVGNPVVALLTLLVLLVTVVPAGAALYRRYRPGAALDAELPQPKPVRFMGTQMDLAILIFGVLLLLAVIAKFR